MVEFPPLPEQLTAETLKERIEAIDKLIPSPSDRAARVFQALKDSSETFDTWDIVCFAAEFLGFQIPNLEFIEDEIRKMASKVSYAHYRNPEIVSNSIEIKT